MKTTIIFLCFLTIFSETLYSGIYEGWIDPDITGSIVPIWMELEESNGAYSGWYVNRIEPDTLYFQGKRQKGSIVLNVLIGNNRIKETFTLNAENGILSGYWKPYKGYDTDVILFPTDSIYKNVMKLELNSAMLKKGKGKQDSITDIHYLMVRKGLASLKVFRERKDIGRPWISYHVIDLLKNREIQLTDYLEQYAFAKLKINGDSFAEAEAEKQLELYSEEEIEQMVQCGFHNNEELHLDNVVLYPNRMSLTLDYLNVFGMNSECDYLLYPIQYSFSFEEFKPCIRQGTFLGRLLQ